MTRPGVLITGLTEARAKFDGAEAMFRNGLRKIFRGVVEPVRTDAGMHAPVGPTGKLASSLRTRISVGRLVSASIATSGVVYAGVRMFGRQARGKSGSVRHLTPNPFLVQAIVRRQPQVVRDVEAGLAQLLREHF